MFYARINNKKEIRDFSIIVKVFRKEPFLYKKSPALLFRVG